MLSGFQCQPFQECLEVEKGEQWAGTLVSLWSSKKDSCFDKSLIFYQILIYTKTEKCIKYELMLYNHLTQEALEKNDFLR